MRYLHSFPGQYDFNETNKERKQVKWYGVRIDLLTLDQYIVILITMEDFVFDLCAIRTDLRFRVPHTLRAHLERMNGNICFVYHIILSMRPLLLFYMSVFVFSYI